MKHRKLLLSISLILLMGSGIFFILKTNFNSIKKEKKPASEAKKAIKGAHKYLTAIRANQNTKTVDMEAVMRAHQQANLLAATKMKSSALSLLWEELGPDNVGGRTRAFLIDRNNTNKMYAGSVSGGLWVSTTGGSSWSKYNDMLENLAIVSIAQTVDGDIYFGTGEGLYTPTGGGSAGIEGRGIWKSDDNGTSFTDLDATWDNAIPLEQAAFINVNKLAAHPTDPNIVYAATKRGVRMTTDGGITWTNPLVISFEATDIDVAYDGTVIAVIGLKVYRSTDGLTFSPTSIFSPSGAGRLEMAISPSNSNYMYCSAANSSGSLLNIYQSKDKGDTWTVIAAGGGNFEPYNSQGAYNNTVEVVPNNPGKIILGGVTLWSWEEGIGWEPLDNTSTSPQNPTYVHADKHTIVFHPNDPQTFFLGTDGGIFKTSDQGKSFVAINKGYNVTQFYTVAVSGTGEVMGGTQDNGTQYIDYKGNTTKTASHIRGGDGGYCEFSLINPNAFFSGVYYGDIARSSNAGSSFNRFYDTLVVPNDNIEALIGNSWSFAHFVTPFLLWEKIDGTTPEDTSFFVGLTNAIWVTKQALDFSITPKWYKIANVSGTPQTMAYSNDGNVLFVGTMDGKLYRISGLNYVRNTLPNYNLTTDTSITTTLITSNVSGAGQVITGIAVDPQDANHIVVTLGNYDNNNYVYRSTNALGSCTLVSIQNDLPEMPVYGAVIDRTISSRIMLATELGVYASDNSGSSWSEENDGMARVATFMIRQQQRDIYGSASSRLYLGTHGRGIFRSNSLVSVNEASIITFRTKVFPNPVRDQAYISFTLSKPADISIEIYSLQGKKIQTLDYKQYKEGSHNLALNTKMLKGGTYIARLKAGNEESTVKFVVIK